MHAPHAPEDVTAVWLTSVLAQQGYEAPVAGFTARNIGTGQVGRNVRFALRYAKGADEGAPTSLVGKFASADPTSRATGIAQHNYVKEVHFYRTLRPLVEIRTPTLLHVDLDETTGLFCLIMEDLHPAVQGDQIRGCGLEEAQLALAEAARLHGPTWNLAALQRDEIINPPGRDAGQLRAIWSMVYEGFVQRYRARLAPRHAALLARFTERLEAYSMPPNAQFALTHGDFRLDNMLFGGPYPLAVVDWQTPALGHPLADVAYFLGAGLLPEVRRAHEADLLRAYYDAVCAYGITGYDFRTCFDDYRRYSFSGLVMAVIASMIVGQTDRGDDMFMAMASRHAEQALDLDAEALLV